MANNGKDFSAKKGLTYSASSSSSASSASVAQGPSYIYQHMPAGAFNNPAPGVMYVKQQGSGQLLFCYRGKGGEVVKLKVSGEVSANGVRTPAIERFSSDIQLQLNALLNVLDPKLHPSEYNKFYETVTDSAMARANSKAHIPIAILSSAKEKTAPGEEARARNALTKALERAAVTPVEKPFANEAIFLDELQALANNLVSRGISYKTEDGVSMASYHKSVEELRNPERVQYKLKQEKPDKKWQAFSPKDPNLTSVGTYPIQDEKASSMALSKRYPLKFQGMAMEFKESYSHKLENDIHPNRLETYLYSIGNNIILMVDQYEQYQSLAEGVSAMKEPITKMVNFLKDIKRILYRDSDASAFTKEFKIFEETIQGDNLLLLTNTSLFEIKEKLLALRDKHRELLRACKKFNAETNNYLVLTFIQSNISNLDKLIGVAENIYLLNCHREFIRNGGLSSLDQNELLQLKLELSMQRDHGHHSFDHEAFLCSWNALIAVVEKKIIYYHRDKYDENVIQLSQMRDSIFIIRCRNILQEFDEIMQHSTASDADKQDAYRAVNIQLREIFPKSEVRRVSLSTSLAEKDSKADKEQSIIEKLEIIVAAERARRDNLLTVATPLETAGEKGKEEETSVSDKGSNSANEEISDNDEDSDSEFAVDPSERPVLNKPLPSPARVSSPDFFSEFRRNTKAPQPHPVSSEAANSLGATETNNEKKATGLGM